MILIRRRLLANPSLTHTLAFAALLVAVGSLIWTIVSHYDETARISQHDAAQAKVQAAASTAELKRLQDAFCGTLASPGLLPVIASAPITAMTTPLGRKLIAESQRASRVIHCFPTKK